jgi:folate-binding Fe-S cluster repair protein YgfZ
MIPAQDPDSAATHPSTMTRDEWNELERRGGIIDLSRSVKLRLGGPDARRYLNGQVSNDVRQLGQDGDSLAACVCTHKGKLEAFVHISCDATGAFYLSADGALRESLPRRLEKYLISDDALLEEISDEWSLVHGWGEAAAGLREKYSNADNRGALVFSANRLRAPGVDLWLPAGAAATDGMTFVSNDNLETVRIDRAIPAWGRELTEDILPPEARLDSIVQPSIMTKDATPARR